ncbi:hypothetical protein [Tumebacillus permanentifrigoris]|uniref:Uncharacterized protein n=1 Tax=Tumebacillus permanentifrigoris TaxID=378543 RepID=A0A316D913_9BACL|nr:hypothetical protein [Tumebacillus permanentifrigoris]PWK11575.1 hypothetical protein C7459_110104 [Tumebacillus permanentifrigoris]
MDWMSDLEARLQARELFQISIDGQIYTVDARGAEITFTNAYGRTDTFSTPDHLQTALQSRFESPVIALI